ncbi:hypothetical protein PoB_000094000 [Plakobranchus ocellatus]|uniref:Uncharacterized protein n=1 Tax=Plakobranchus ocellatus TaxID=259542 RepID=A0AAV3XUB3_9GAST|nr:hypothetical protein PoB_000094000 [Plakobranchus ocellatus]
MDKKKTWGKEVGKKEKKTKEKKKRHIADVGGQNYREHDRKKIRLPLDILKSFSFLYVLSSSFYSSVIPPHTQLGPPSAAKTGLSVLSPVFSVPSVPPTFYEALDLQLTRGLLQTSASIATPTRTRTCYIKVSGR